MGSRARTATTLALLALALLLVAVVARSGPSHPFAVVPKASHASVTPSGSPPPSRPATTGVATATPAPPDQQHDSGVLKFVVAAFIVLSLLAIVLRYGRNGWTLGTRAQRARHLLGDEHPEADDPQRQALAHAVTSGLATIETGPVTDAVVACWVRLEQAAAEAGVPPRPSETSTEFVVRVLQTYGAGERPLRRLAALFREARFSRHHMDEARRTEARSCLHEMNVELGTHS